MDLNDQQRAAILELKRPVLVLAGPGTGKTRTLVSKVAWLLHQPVAPADIVALTFTNKAAAEMKSRVRSLVQQGGLPFIGTFHSLAHHILTEAGRNVSLISERERTQIIWEVRQEQAMKELSTKEISLLLSRQKNSVTEERHPIIDQYNKKLQARGLVDFDDLLLEVLQIVNRQYRYILVDEFQDTNQVQYELLKKLAAPEAHVFVIGDPLQSIYAFRGASPHSFEQFKKDFPNYREITLVKNYRSGATVIHTSQALFPDSIPLEAVVESLGTVSLVTTATEKTEAAWIVGEISRRMGGMDLNQAGERKGGADDTIRFSDFAVIYRTHDIGRTLEQTLVESGIPYQVIGGDSLYEQREIQVITTALRLLAQPEQAEALRLELLASPLLKNQPSKVAGLSLLNTTQPLSQLTEEVITLCGIREKIVDQPRKQRNLYEFLSTLVRFDKKADGLAQFVRYLDYLEEHEYYDTQADKVTLLTMHAAKGLEFAQVFIAGFEEGLIPYTRKAETEEESAEEKRLLYVAMTRAKAGLSLLRANRRYKQATQPSRFASLIQLPLVTIIEDPVIQQIRKRQAKVRQQKSQLKLL
jgi:superfamily I DNA/RNA helicase